jgi:polyhydroxybutyrate depolymerase
LQERLVQWGGLSRRYLVCLPPDLKADRPVPLVIMIHGGGGSGRGAAWETGWDRQAQAKGFIAVFPEGTAIDPTAPASFVRNARVWNDGSGRFTTNRPVADDIGFLSCMLDELCARYPVDRKRIYATGFSNGASMAFRAGVELSTRLAAVAPVAGAFWLTEPRPARPVSLCYITGDADPLNPLGGGVPRTAGGLPLGEGRSKPPVADSIARWVRMVGCPPEAQPLTGPPGVTVVRYGPGNESAEVLSCIVADCGHSWPGGKSLLPKWMVGKTTDRLNATDAIWTFFQQHPMP